MAHSQTARSSSTYCSVHRHLTGKENRDVHKSIEKTLKFVNLALQKCENEHKCVVILHGLDQKGVNGKPLKCQYLQRKMV